jgi:hypothetical protein
MTPRLHTFIIVAALALSPWHAAAVMAQVFHFTHGAVESGHVKTDDSIVSFSSTAGWIVVPNSNLTVTLAAGDDDLFVIEFNTTCSRHGGSSAEVAAIEVKAYVSVGFLGVQELEPGGSGQRRTLCMPTSSTISAHSMMWAVRLSNDTAGPKKHTFSIWARIFEPDDGLGQFRQRTVKLTRYN